LFVFVFLGKKFHFQCEMCYTCLEVKEHKGQNQMMNHMEKLQTARTRARDIGFCDACDELSPASEAFTNRLAFMIFGLATSKADRLSIRLSYMSGYITGEDD